MIGERGYGGMGRHNALKMRRGKSLEGSSPSTPSYSELCMKSRHRKWKHATIIFVDGVLVMHANNTQEEHAEVRALNAARMLGYKAYDMTLMSLRVTKAGKLAMAKPCRSCLKYMSMFRDIKIFYSNERGIIRKL